VKRLDTATSINAMAIANLSSIVKDIVMQSQNQFQQISHDILWLNVILQNYSELYSHQTTRICIVTADLSL